MANQYDLWLVGIPGIGPRKITSIINACGTARDCFFLKEEALRFIPLLREEDIQRIVQSRRTMDPARLWDRLTESKVSVIGKGENGYPERLLSIPDPPHLLFYRGKLPDADHMAVAMVGARECTAYGRDMAKRIAGILAGAGIDVISGMARGIDSASHEGALSGDGETYAVLGCGADICYPNSAGRLYEKLVSRCGVLSEYLPGTMPERGFFPARNRLISALSDAVLVIEARERSGSLITSDLALEQGRDIYALPGRITDALSAGTNQLIRQGAYPIVSAEELLSDLKGVACRSTAPIMPRQERLSETERLVWNALEILPTGLEDLLQKTGLPIQTLTKTLEDLTRKDLTEEGFPGAYRRRY